MRLLASFAQGTKHPETHPTIFKNVWEWDRLRKILKGRCAKCNATVSSDSKSYKELVYRCGKKDCECMRSVYTPGAAHQVCETCYDMWHSLYGNKFLENYNYFKNLDERDANEGGGEAERRKRMGL